MKRACKHSQMDFLAQAGADVALTGALDALLLQTGSTAAVVGVLRELVADPFRPVTLRHEWLRNNGGAAGHLAEAIDSEGRYDEMPILGDALEDAGCRVALVLDHCRAAVTHARGCWVLDLLLGRSEMA